MPKKYLTVYHRIQAELQKEYDALHIEITTNWTEKYIATNKEFKEVFELWKQENCNEELNEKIDSLSKELDMCLRKMKTQSKNLSKNIPRFRKIESEISELSGYRWRKEPSLPSFNYKKL